MVLGKYWYRGTLARLDLLLIRIAGTYVMSLRRHKKATDLHSRSLALVKCPSNIRWLFKSSKSLINRRNRARRDKRDDIIYMELIEGRLILREPCQ
jgi:hypothetical protein